MPQRAILQQALRFTAVFWMLAILGGRAAAQQDEGDVVQLNFGQAIQIQGLVDYVSERLGINILYDDRIANKTVNIQAPAEIPAESLLELLQSALRMKGLALVDAEAPGWKRIIQTSDLVALATSGDAQEIADQHGTATAVTQVFELEHSDPQRLDQIIKPFLTQPGANSQAIAEPRLLIVTDYASNVLKIAQLIKMIDQPRTDAAIRFYAAQHVSATALGQQITQMLTARTRLEGNASSPSDRVEVVHDERTNQLIFIGSAGELEDVATLAQSLDVPLGTRTEIYDFDYVSAERVDSLLKELIDPLRVERLYRSAIDEEDNLLIVTTTEEIHQKLREVRLSLDVATSTPESPVQFYRLENNTATEVLQTLRAIEQSHRGGSPEEGFPTDGRIRLRDGWNVPGPNRQPQGPDPLPGGAFAPQSPAVRTDGISETSSLVDNFLGAGQGALLGRARITADVASNTLIVVGNAEVQSVYAELIEYLDRRRPQVLIEATMVVLDTSDSFALGVEVSGGDVTGGKRLFSFSSFGLSKVDPTTGALALIPGLGFNGTLVDPDVADVVIRALTTHDRGRVMASPRLLVSDNATGLLTSVEEVPFTSVNASQTVATTSFAGFAEAGTTITVTPHISDGDHLQLEYRVTLNSFTGTGADGVPPPRQTDEVESFITIPDGHTVIVGGLNRRNRSQEVVSFPFIEQVPFLRHLASNQSVSDESTTLYVFIKPIILRDDKFHDLRYLSGCDLQGASLPSEFPQSEPVLIR